MLGSKIEANIIKIYSSGIDPQISIKRCKYRSVLPAKYPWIAPKNNPMIMPIAVKARAKITDNLKP